MWLHMILIASILAFASAGAWPCSCAADGLTPDERIERAKYIYLGRVVSIRVANPEAEHGSFAEFNVRIAVLERWKGTAPSTVRAKMHDIFNNPDAASDVISSCRPPLGTDGVIVVLTDEEKPAFNACSQNIWWLQEDEVTQVRDDVFELLEAREPLARGLSSGGAEQIRSHHR